MRRKLASRYLKKVHGVKLAPTTLAKLACLGGGPKYLKDGLFPLYPAEYLDEFAALRLGPLRSSTSDTPSTRVGGDNRSSCPANTTKAVEVVNPTTSYNQQDIPLVATCSSPNTTR
jgi:hypothetical protein